MTGRRSFFKKIIGSAGILGLGGNSWMQANALVDEPEDFNSEQFKSLNFNNQGRFKIVQFTDLHLSVNKKQSAGKTIKLIENILNEETPDLVMFTGDVVVSNPAGEGWEMILSPLQDRSIPWAVTPGNHDEEQDMTREQLLDFLMQKRDNMNSPESPDIHGAGNGVIILKPLYPDLPPSVIWCFDTNAYSSMYGISKYDWVRFDQIDWYRKLSQSFKMNNQGFALPSLAFFHIPLPEYKNLADREEFTGTYDEKVSSPEINTGLFAQMVGQQDVIGTFAGHDHNNDFVGLEKDILLSYGRVTGYNAYGHLERGGRVVELFEGKFRFNTWIRTLSGTENYYEYPASGENGHHEELLAASFPEKPQKGIRYRYYEGKYLSVSEIKEMDFIKSGVLETISLSPAERKDHYAFIFEGWIKVPYSTQYNFYLRSDDGSRLIIDDVIVVDNDGSHSTKTYNGCVNLGKGFHKFELKYFENYMGQALELGFSSLYFRKRLLPADSLFHHSVEAL